MNTHPEAIISALEDLDAARAEYRHAKANHGYESAEAGRAGAALASAFVTFAELLGLAPS